MTPRKLLPPVYFLIYLLTAYAWHRVWPIMWLVPTPLRRWGMVPLAAGFLVMSWGAMLFWARGTPVKPFEPSTALVLEGPYRWTRNPMYLGLVMMLAGIAILLGSAAAWLAPVAMAVTLQRIFIPHEERLLEQTFGDQYRMYRQRVHRWI